MSPPAVIGCLKIALLKDLSARLLAVDLEVEEYAEYAEPLLRK
jgi:hypothetical protein